MATILRDVETRTLKAEYRAMYDTPYRDDPKPMRQLLPRRSFLTTTSLIATRGCHNRCGFCYLSTDGLQMPYRMRDPQQIAAEWLDNGEPYAVFIDNNLGSRGVGLPLAVDRRAAQHPARGQAGQGEVQRVEGVLDALDLEIAEAAAEQARVRALGVRAPPP